MLHESEFMELTGILSIVLVSGTSGGGHPWHACRAFPGSG